MRRRVASALAASLCLICACSACSSHESRGRPQAPRPSATATSKPQFALTSDGKARVTVVAPGRLFAPAPPRDKSLPPLPRAQAEAIKQGAKRLKASVEDLVHYLSLMSGAELQLVTDPAQVAAGSTPLFVGEAAPTALQAIAAHSPGAQSFRISISPGQLALVGESDLATSYAIYELLDQLGCRWFMPGELGEVIPRRARLELPLGDTVHSPGTLYRGLWYADEAFQRRNRLGGIKLAAGHNLERWVTEDERSQNPDWRAVINGVPHASRLRWSNPDVASAIALHVSEQLAKTGDGSASLSPGDGSDFDDTLDRALDAGDWDPSVNGVSLTDRLLVLANRVAAQLRPQYPDVMLGLLAYSSYTRPPVRERVDPNVVPVLAPITYCRQHPWSDDACPGAEQARRIVQGWGARAEKLAYRGYAFNLSEPAAPNPMQRKWSYELPFLFSHNVRFFQPETLPNFETSLPALWLGLRLAWNPKLQPEVALRELYELFYGHAAREVRAYIELVDAAWADTNEFSGGGLGYAQRFPAPRVAQARAALEHAKAACQTEPERARVALLDASLGQLELYLSAEQAFRSGDPQRALGDYERWRDKAAQLSEQYAENSAFGKVRWAGAIGVYAYYAQRFLEPIYLEGARLARSEQLLTSKPLCAFQYRLAPQQQLPITSAPAELTPADPRTDACTETWSTLGQYDYFGAMWYQTQLELTAGASPNQPAFIWFSKVDGVVQAWLDGQPLRPHTTPATAVAGTTLSAELHLAPITFEAPPGLARPSAHRLTVLVRRTRLAELGAGGLLGPVYVYAAR